MRLADLTAKVDTAEHALAVLRRVRMECGAVADEALAGTEPTDETAAAIGRIEEAYQAFRTAAGAVTVEMGRLVATGGLRVGDVCVTIVGKPVLVVASIFAPGTGLEDLAEVTLTADGGRVEHRTHSWPLDADGHPAADGVELVRYERWWAGGLRVAGTVHPRSRRITSTD